MFKLLVDSLEQNICWKKTTFHQTNSWTSIRSEVELKFTAFIYILGSSMCMLRQGCSLSMLHRTCKKVHGGIRLGGLGMPNIMHMFFLF